MNHLTHRHVELTPIERWMVTFLASLIILFAWGTAFLGFIATAVILAVLWFADSVWHHRLVFTTLVLGIAIFALLWLA